MTVATFNTNGHGLWSNKSKAVRIEGFTVNVYDDDSAALNVNINTADWDVYADGLIYTDEQFVADVRNFFNCNDVHYSEQGLQGEDYVNFDVGADFVKAANKLLAEKGQELMLFVNDCR